MAGRGFAGCSAGTTRRGSVHEEVQSTTILCKQYRSRNSQTKKPTFSCSRKVTSFSETNQPEARSRIGLLCCSLRVPRCQKRSPELFTWWQTCLSSSLRRASAPKNMFPVWTLTSEYLVYDDTSKKLDRSHVFSVGSNSRAASAARGLPSAASRQTKSPARSGKPPCQSQSGWLPRRGTAEREQPASGERAALGSGVHSS